MRVFQPLSSNPEKANNPAFRRGPPYRGQTRWPATPNPWTIFACNAAPCSRYVGRGPDRMARGGRASRTATCATDHVMTGGRHTETERRAPSVCGIHHSRPSRLPPLLLLLFVASTPCSLRGPKRNSEKRLKISATWREWLTNIVGIPVSSVMNTASLSGPAIRTLNAHNDVVSFLQS